MDDLKNTVMAPAAEQPLTIAAAKLAGPDKQTRKQAKFSDYKKPGKTHNHTHACLTKPTPKWIP